MVFDEKARHGFELELHPTRQLTSVLNECRGGCCPPGVIVIKPFSPLFNGAQNKRAGAFFPG
jgi:hypothetical protein